MATLHDDCTSVAWDKYADYGGKITTLTCTVASIIGFIIGQHIVVQVYVFFVAFGLAILEFPVIYAWSDQCQKLTRQCNEEWHMAPGWPRGVLYIALSIVMFIGPSIAVWPGIFLLITAILLFLTSYSNKVNQQDAYEAGLSGGDDQPAPQGSGAAAPVGGRQDDSFGTF